MKIDVIVIREDGSETCLVGGVSESTAKIVAASQSGRTDQQVYIRWYRAEDGQTGYLNRDGHNPVGHPW